MFTDKQIVYLCIFLIVVIYILFSKIGKYRIDREVEINSRVYEQKYKDYYYEKIKEIQQQYQRSYEAKLQELSSREDAIIRDENDLAKKRIDFNWIVAQEVSAKIEKGMEISHSHFLQYPVFSEMKGYDYQKNNKLYLAASERAKFISGPDVSAVIQGKSGVYNVTLENCSCPDFQQRGLPCKHMFRLAFQVGLANYIDTPVIENNLVQLKQSCDTVSKNLQSLKKEVQNLQRKKELYEEGIKRITQQSNGSAWIANQIADWQFLVDMKLSESLTQKSHPALKSSDAVRKVASEKKDLIVRVKELEYKVALYESLDPSLTATDEYTSKEIREALAEELDDGQKYLPADEYNRLTEGEKWQLALNNWRNRRRSNWQVGRDFERYIGYLYEMDGYRVEYFGALEGKMDLGRDLIAKKKKEIVIIQCKRWADHKTIHEKHVFQLFGSVVGYEMEHPGTTPKGLLITTCPLSDVAIAYADRLSIEYKQNYPTVDLDSYPLIKCNIGHTGERIFHLPFDQQYDRVNIDQSKGEFYAVTVQEALDAGFRRAYRWRGQ